MKVMNNSYLSRIEKTKIRADRYLSQFESISPADSENNHHTEASNDQELEAWIYDGTRSFDAIWHLFEQFQKEAYVSAYPIEDMQKAEQFFKVVFAKWLSIAERGIEPFRLSQERIGSIEGWANFMQKITAAKEFLSTFRSFPRSQLDCMQGWDATEEEIRELQEAVRGNQPSVKREARKVESGDASFIR
ncbi:MAG: hypothetical protein U0798_12535 [Gemmataceae bacterium]